MHRVQNSALHTYITLLDEENVSMLIDCLFAAVQHAKIMPVAVLLCRSFAKYLGEASWLSFGISVPFRFVYELLSSLRIICCKSRDIMRLSITKRAM